MLARRMEKADLEDLRGKVPCSLVLEQAGFDQVVLSAQVPGGRSFSQAIETRADAGALMTSRTAADGRASTRRTLGPGQWPAGCG